MTQANAYQISDWNGDSGERWVANQERLDHMLAVFGKAAIDAASPRQGEHVIDIGCGAGTSTLELAARVGATGHVTGLDISEPLIALARTRMPPNGPIDLLVADAGNAAFHEQKFDLLFSRFGVMFFDDPAASFAHMRSMLKPGGRMTFVCWREAARNDWVRLPMAAVRDIVPHPKPPDPEAPGPFSLGDRDRITRILSEAGFSEIAIDAFDHDISFGQGATREAALDDAVGMAFQVGPLSRLLADEPDAVRTRAIQAVRYAFARRPGEGTILIDGAAWIVSAINPAQTVTKEVQ